MSPRSDRFKIVIETYQTTSHVPEALERLTEAYYALGFNDEAQASAAVLGYNFPDSSWYKDSYELLVQRHLAARPARSSAGDECSDSPGRFRAVSDAPAPSLVPPAEQQPSAEFGAVMEPSRRPARPTRAPPDRASRRCRKPAPAPRRRSRAGAFNRNGERACNPAPAPARASIGFHQGRGPARHVVQAFVAESALV